MKKIGVVVFALLLSNAFAQVRNAEWGFGYSFSAPQGTMRQNMTQAHGGFLDFYVSPADKRFALGGELSINGYGRNKTEQTYTFDDGSTAPMDVIVTNNFYNMMLAGRYYLSTGKIQPFVSGKAGLALYATNLNVYDPDDFDHCEPVDTDVLKRDATMIFSAGGGLRWEVMPKKMPGKFFMNLAANYTTGGKVDYMNADAPKHSHSNHTSDVYMKFLNTQTQVVHEHHVGNVYSSLVELLDVRLTFTLRMH
jgi:hypothetical protein